FPLSEINLPPNHRFNAGFDVAYRRFTGNLSVSYTGEAFWQDVLDQRYHGTTDAYTLLNGAIGVRWGGNKLQASLKLTNITNEEVRQHIFGDVLRRRAVGELRVAF